MEAATARKLDQEMGIQLVPAFSHKFLYRTLLERGLIEHEIDHVFTGRFDGTPVPNQEEVADWRYVSMDDLRREIKSRPQDFTYWFRLIVDQPELVIPATVHT